VGEGAAPSEVIDDDLVDALCLAGDEDDVRRRLDAYGKAGVREIALFGVGTDAQSREMLKTLARIAR
jgi:alkanesulfonate monooxygenase SsuD/methylene tetrahydromethanopterin reductase-like flavin-dependent oxidoreductase (luciferase family)